jgi:hypothetical protein
MLAPRLGTEGRRGAAVAIAALLATTTLVALRGVPPWLLSPAHDVAPTEAEIEAQHGIGDERRVYHAKLGLFGVAREIPVFGALHALVRPGGTDGGGTRERGRVADWILLNGAVGSAGFGAGAHGHVLDPLLCDPLLTRLPARDPTRWRIGHVLRRVPEGYYETLASGENRLHHAGLRAWYDALRTATRAPVLAPERLPAIWRLATDHDGLRAYVAEHYRTPPRLEVAATDLPGPLPPGTLWFDEPALRVVYDGVLAVQWGAPQQARALRLEVLGACDFRVRFVVAAKVVGDVAATPLPPAAGVTPLQAVVGLRAVEVVVPAGVGPFDALWVDAVENVLSHAATGPPALGAIELAR